MLKAYKYRIYPTSEQRLYLAKTFGCTRFVYNQMLADRIKSYEENKDLDIKAIKYPTPAQYKKEYEWLKEVDSLALANAQMNLDKAYKNFFRDKSVGFPKFKSKKTNRFSYTTNNQNGTISIDGNFVKIPKNDNKIGIDLGLKEFAICSNGDRFDNPKNLRKSEKKLSKLQKDLSRKQKGSNNRYKARLKVAKLHQKIANQRKDFLHKLSTKIISENQVIVLEDLRVKNMLQNHKLAKAISEVSWAEFRTMLEYKASWNSREIIIAPSNYASSQLCSECGYKNSDVKNLALRNWTCPECGVNHDRDINASINLLKLAM